MSKSSKRKYVTREVLDDFVLPEGKQQVVKVRQSTSLSAFDVQQQACYRIIIISVSYQNLLTAFYMNTSYYTSSESSGNLFKSFTTRTHSVIKDLPNRELTGHREIERSLN